MATKNGGKGMNQQKRALNQLLSVIVGSKFARQTDPYKDQPLERIHRCYELITQEQSEAFGNSLKLNQINRKLDSLNSLTILAKLEKSVEALRDINYE